jgi:hypothetical protein
VLNFAWELLSLARSFLRVVTLNTSYLLKGFRARSPFHLAGMKLARAAQRRLNPKHVIKIKMIYLQARKKKKQEELRSFLISCTPP